MSLNWFYSYLIAYMYTYDFGIFQNYEKKKKMVMKSGTVFFLVCVLWLNYSFTLEKLCFLKYIMVVMVFTAGFIRLSPHNTLYARLYNNVNIKMIQFVK